MLPRAASSPAVNINNLCPLGSKPDYFPGLFRDLFLLTCLILSAFCINLTTRLISDNAPVPMEPQDKGKPAPKGTGLTSLRSHYAFPRLGPVLLAIDLVLGFAYRLKAFQL